MSAKAVEAGRAQELALMSAASHQQISHCAVALFSSSRRDGNTGQFIDHIAGELGMEVIELEKLDISTFDYQHRNRNDGFEPLMKRLLQFEQMIFASPVYWYSVTAAMKRFLDRLSDYLDLPDLLTEGRR